MNVANPVVEGDIRGLLFLMSPECGALEVESLLPLFPKFVATGLLFKLFYVHGLRTGIGVCFIPDPSEHPCWSPRRGGRNEERPDP